MKDGIYHVTFSSSTGGHGEGIAIFKDGAVNGGDDGYLYIGKKSEESGRLTSTLLIKRWNAGADSVFGSIDQFSLEVSGPVSDAAEFVVTGHVVGQPQAQITIRGRYLAAPA